MKILELEHYLMLRRVQVKNKSGCLTSPQWDVCLFFTVVPRTGISYRLFLCEFRRGLEIFSS